MTVYKSKIGLSIVLLLVLVLGTTSYLMIKDGAWLGLLLNILVALVIGYIFIQTRYTIKGDILIVKCTFLINKSYEIKRITKIIETNNPLSAPAASLDRLEINFDNYDSVLISPKQKSEFIIHLKALNPNIVVTLKK